jgi:hypothetical protein
MTAVKPARLNEQIDEVLDDFSDPIALRRKCVDILDLYADRTRRPNLMETMDEAAHSLRVPRPVIRAFGVAFRRRAQEQPEHARAASAALWEAGYRETQLLACSVLSGQVHDDVAKWAIDYVAKCDDQEVVAEMAKAGLQGWRISDVSRFLAAEQVWLNDSNRGIRSFALLALSAAAEDDQFKDIPSIFRLIAGFTAKAKGGERRALRRLIEALVDRSPPEAARFLMDEVAEGGNPAENFARSTLEFFPSRQRRLLERTLSSQ